jgi:flagellar basal-body rod modification protein FlgD
MAQVPNVGSGSSGGFGSASTLNDVNMDDFLKLMIAELQNQDPLNPLENDQLIAQISQIRSVGATEKLTQTLDSVLLGQNISSATNLIGAEVDAIADDNNLVTGVVNRVSVSEGHPKLHLDLKPTASVQPIKGNVAAGEYEYRVVWDSNGTIVGVDPLQGGTLKVSEGGKSILLSNLPQSASAKQVYRREKGSEDFELVASITDGKKATFLDSNATRDLSGYVLNVTPQLVDTMRKFVVSLKNVGEIRRLTAAGAPSEADKMPEVPESPATPETPAEEDDEPAFEGARHEETPAAA